MYVKIGKISEVVHVIVFLMTSKIFITLRRKEMKVLNQKGEKLVLAIHYSSDNEHSTLVHTVSNFEEAAERVEKHKSDNGFKYAEFYQIDIYEDDDGEEYYSAPQAIRQLH